MKKFAGTLKTPPKMAADMTAAAKGMIAAALLTVYEASQEKDPEVETILAGLATDLKDKSFPLDLVGWPYEPSMQVLKERTARRLSAHNASVIQQAMQAALGGIWGEFGPLYDHKGMSFEVSVAQDKANKKVGIAITTDGVESESTWMDIDKQAIYSFIDRNGDFTSRILTLGDDSCIRQLQATGWNNVTLKVILDNKPPVSGYWKPGTHTIEIYVSKQAFSRGVAPSVVQYNLTYHLDTLRHEMQHMTQEIMKNLAFNFHEAGHPTKDTVDSLKTYKRPKEEDEEERDDTFEYLMPDEFIPRVQDAIDTFNDRKDLIPPEMMNKAIRIFGGAQEGPLVPDSVSTLHHNNVDWDRSMIDALNELISVQSIFTKLKAHDTKTWREAFSRFYRDVT